VARLTTYLDLKSLEIPRSGFDFKSNLTSAIGNLANRDIWQAKFPAIMPLPMTLAPTNEAVRRENHAEKNHISKKINRHDPGGHERCKDSITIKKV
jgi:hypothetical protein